MAVIIGDIHRAHQQVSPLSKPFTWLSQHFGSMFSSRRNPSPFPDRVWHRHSALLDAGWKCRLNRS